MLLAARLGWGLVAMLALVNLLASLSEDIPELLERCVPQQEECVQGQLTDAGVRALEQLGLPVGMFNAYAIIVTVLGIAIFWVVGLLVFSRSPNDRVALLFSLILITAASGGVTKTYPELHWVGRLMTFLSDAGLAIFLLTFPNGRFVPRWTRWLGLTFTLHAAGNIFLDGSPADTDTWPPLLAGAFFAIFISAGLFSPVYRYLRVSSPIERQQTKIVLYSIVTFLVLWGIALSAYMAFPAIWPEGTLGESFVAVTLNLPAALIPLAIGIAVLRYRLWDVDVLVNRALVYGTLTASLVAVYLASVTLGQWLLRILIGQGSSVAVVASTLAVAALFQPLRRRIQVLIDRRFYRHRYDTAQTLAAYSAGLRDEVALEALTGRLMGVVQETVQPAHISLWLRTPERKG